MELEKYVYALESDFASKAVALISTRQGNELFGSLNSTLKEEFISFARVHTEACFLMKDVSHGLAKIDDGADVRLSIRRLKNILEAYNNFGRRCDLLAGVSMDVSPGLAALEKVRYGAMENPPTQKPATPDKPPKRGKRHGEISQIQAAALCGVGLRTLQEWERGKRVPEGYPGRSNAVVFAAWAQSHVGRKRLAETAREMNRAKPTDPELFERTACASAFDDDY